MSKIDYANPELYENRELSWLDFNYRVLSEADSQQNPLLEQLRFLGIGSSNLDEFFMVRVAGLQDQVKSNYTQTDNKTQLSPEEQLEAISVKNRLNVEYQYSLYKEVTQELTQYGVFFKSINDLSPEEKQLAENVFFELVFPTLTPLGIDAYRPFPNLQNKLINVFVHLEKDGASEIAVVPLPALADQFVPIEIGDEVTILYTEDLVTHYIGSLFNGYTVTSTFNFRVTRNADLEIHEQGAEDLLIVIEDYLKERKKGMAVRLEVDFRNPYKTIQEDIDYLTTALELEARDVYLMDGPLDLTVLGDIATYLSERLPTLSYPPFSPVYPEELIDKTIYELADEKDLFFHHPYDSFYPIVEFIQQAAEDPHVLAIKQTLYRVSSDSPIVQALKQAVDNGKQVTVLVELKARFDEERNVQWAKELEEAGCHVIYGMNNLKTHSKISLVVKKNGNTLTRYVHLGTGNYNDSTAKLYTDMGLITTNKEIGEDATNFFNYLSGYSQQPVYNHLSVSPFDIRDSYIEDIDTEIAFHQQFGNGHMIAKMNSLTDKVVIEKLYEASQAGVKIDLIIRGICCLRSQIPGVSENIRVVSIVGRFLEHSRIYYFRHNGAHKLYLSSADMMTRNMVKRVEIEFPILDDEINQTILSILEVYLKDNVKARQQLADGSYQLIQNDAPLVNSQQYFMEQVVNERDKRGFFESN
ncbi:RNA degradosome polyphosphate kinase [Desemzia sp. C1]|uniref:RNA degradosome polyphosphate kinase n=1 Tax=Desemzia sp. C1 TaxID=2892016 RepID=UPI001E381AB1|nr:RNA degradosome polyphosphate kinase [Desemzia sp. C1]MCI3028049.1 RNA degradosome polyphosphate kinase [Desemzia sp. C1]